VRSRAAAVAAAFAISAALASCGLIPASPQAFARRIKDADAAILSGDDRLSRKALDGLARAAGRDASRWYSVLRRERGLENAGNGAGRYAGKIREARRRCGDGPAFGYLDAERLLSRGDPRAALEALGAFGAAGVDAAGLGKAMEGTGKKIALAAALAYVDESDSGPVSLSPEAWDAIAEASGDPRYAINAAIASLYVHDRPGAALRALEALRGGARVDPELLFACGLLEETAAAATDGYGPPPAVVADALYLSGDLEGARRAWLERASSMDSGGHRDWLNAALTHPDPATGAVLLREAVARFPQKPELAIALESLVERAGLDEADSPSSGGDPYGSDDGGSGSEAGTKEGVEDGAESGASPAPANDEAAFFEEWIECARRIKGAEAARAEAEAMRFLARRPERPEAAEFAFLSLLGIGRPEGAFQALALHQAAVRGKATGDPADPAYPNFALPWALAAKGDAEGAAEAFKDRSSSGADAGAAINAAILYRRASRSEEAVKVLSAAIGPARPGREKADLYVALGDAYLERGERRLAAAAFEAALSQDPGNAVAEIRLARTREAGGDGR